MDFSDSFAAWTKQAEESVKSYRSQGLIPTKVAIDPDDFAIWCRANSKPLNASSRARFAVIRGHAIAGN